MADCNHTFELTTVRKDGFVFKAVVCHRCKRAWASVRHPESPGRPFWRVVDADGTLQQIE